MTFRNYYSILILGGAIPNIELNICVKPEHSSFVLGATKTMDELLKAKDPGTSSMWSMSQQLIRWSILTPTAIIKQEIIFGL